MTSMSLYHQWHRVQESVPADKRAIRCGEGVIRYGEFGCLIESLAACLIRNGLKPGDRAVLYMTNSPEYIVSFFAVSLCGGIVVPVAPSSGNRRFRHILSETDPELLLHAFGNNPASEGNVRQISVSLSYFGKTPSMYVNGTTVNGDNGNFPSVQGEEPAIILYTAGSSGKPKGAVLSHNQLVHIANTLRNITHMDSKHRELIIAPITHSGGWQRVTATLFSGGEVVFFHGILTIPTFLSVMERHRITGFFSTPPFIRMILQTPPSRMEKPVKFCRNVEIASAPMYSDEICRLQERFTGAHIFMQYGLTECSRALMVNTTLRPDKRHTVGSPTAGVQVTIADRKGEPLPAGEQGEIFLKAPQLTKGYWKESCRIANRLNNGWFATGDMGMMDADGFLTLKGRKDDMINSGGVSFFPAEVEAEIGSPDGLESYIIAGVTDPGNILTQVPWMFVVPRNPGTWSPAVLSRTLRKNLPPAMIPRRIVVIPSLPVTDSGKPNRRKTVELYAGGRSERP